MAMRDPLDIDFSTFPESDGQPMAETLANAIQMTDLQWALQTLFAGQGRGGTTTVGGNQFVYYNRFNGRDNVSPDVYVAFDRPPPGPPKWQTWVEGKFPDIVFEITSPSTEGVDVSAGPGGKRRLYAVQGAREYYIYDPQQEMDPVFRGYELREGRMEPLPLLGGSGIYSPLLGAELRPLAVAQSERRPAGVWLRVIDPASGQPVPTMDEEHRDLQEAREELSGARTRLIEADRARLEADRARLEAEQRLAAAERARAEEVRQRAALEEELRRLRGHDDG